MSPCSSCNTGLKGILRNKAPNAIFPELSMVHWNINAICLMLGERKSFVILDWGEKSRASNKPLEYSCLLCWWGGYKRVWASHFQCNTAVPPPPMSLCDESLSSDSQDEKARGALYLKCKDRPFSAFQTIGNYYLIKKQAFFLPSHLWVEVSSR